MSADQQTASLPDSLTPQCIADYECHIGENPLWNPVDQRLYWCDIPHGRVFAYEPGSGSHRLCLEGEAVGGFTIQQDGALLLFMARGAIKKWRDGKFTTVVEEIPEERENRFNDVIADPSGRVLCGTMSIPARRGRLYRLDRDGSLTVLLEDIGCSNGMAFSPDRKQLYYTDSYARKIYLFDYDLAAGAITNRRIFVTFPDTEGMPDGMTMDSDGAIWSALWDGGCLVRLTSEGKEQLRISFPAKKVSSVTFGGKDYSDIYVTTAGGENKPEEGSGAGALYRLETGFRGVPEFFSRIGE
jgi:D-xylonolactonase